MANLNATLTMDTKLMQQYLPERAMGGQYARVEMVPDVDGRVIILALDYDGALSLILSGVAGFTRWTVIPVDDLGGGRSFRVVDFDIASNVESGRRDGTVDLAVIADFGTPDAPDRHAFYWPGQPATADPEAWQLAFARARPLTPEAIGCDAPNWVRVGVLPMPTRSLLVGRLGWQSDDLAWQVGRVTFDGAEATGVASIAPPVPQTSMSANTVAATAASRVAGGHLEDALICNGPDWDPPRSWVCLPPDDDGGQVNLPLTGLMGNGAYTFFGTLLDDDGADATILTHANNVADDPEYARASWLHLNRPETTESAATLLPTGDLRLCEQRLTAVHTPGLADAWHRFSQYRPAPGEAAMLVHTMGDAIGDDASTHSSYLTADVFDHCACLCTQATPDGVVSELHAVVAYEQGGLELFTLDNVSRQWRRYRVTDGDLADAYHEAASYTTTVTVTDDTGAPIPGAAVRITPANPAYATVNAEPAHLTPAVPTVVTANASGQVAVVFPVTTLSAPEIAVEVLDTPPAASPALTGHSRGRIGRLLSAAEAAAIADQPVAAAGSLNPMQVSTGELRGYTDAASIQSALRDKLGKTVSDTQAANAHEMLHTCLGAYDATLSPTSSDGRSVQATVLRRLHLRVESGQVSLLDPDAPAPADTGLVDIWGDLGDICSYLWQAIDAFVETAVDIFVEVTDGLYQIAVQIGSIVWRGVVALATQAAELIDWGLQATLGISLLDIVRWIGSFFDWDGILNAKVDIDNLVRLCANSWSGFLAGAEDWMIQHLEEIRALANKPVQGDGESDQVLALPAGNGGDSVVPDRPDPASPDADWGTAQFSNYGHLSTFRPGAVSGDDPWTTAEAVISAAVGNFTGGLGSMMAWASDPNNAVGQASGAAVLKEMEKVGANAFVDGLETVITGLAPAVDAWLQTALEQGRAELAIPVLSPLYKELTGNPLSVFDAQCLLGAIGLTFATAVASTGPLISPELSAKIRSATTLDDLFAEGDDVEGVDLTLAIVAAVFQVVMSAIRIFELVTYFAMKAAPTVINRAYHAIAEILADALAFAYTTTFWARAKAVAPLYQQLMVIQIGILMMANFFDLLEFGTLVRCYREGRTPSAAYDKMMSGGAAMVTGIALLVGIGQGVAGLVQGPPPKDTDPTKWRMVVVFNLIGGSSNNLHDVIDGLYGYNNLPKPENLVAALFLMKCLRAAMAAFSSVTMISLAGSKNAVPGMLSG